MEVLSSPPAHRMVGTVAVVTGIAGPVGQAVARRLAAECRCIVFSDPDARAARAVLAEVERIRALQGLDEEPVFVEADAATEEGARSVTHTAIATFGRVDAVVVNGEVTVRNGRGGGNGALCISMEAFVPMVRMAAAALERQSEGNVVLTALLGGAWPGMLGETARKVAVSSFSSFVHAAASALHDRGVTLNGVALEDPLRADPTLDVVAPLSAAVRADRQRRSHQFYDAAYTARFLASSEARGVTGQVFLLSGGEPVAPSLYVSPDESAAFTDLFQHIERLDL